MKNTDRKCFQNTGFGWWNEGEIAECLRVPGGGDSTKANLVVETLVFDEAQITCPTNRVRPLWGGCCHTLSRDAGRSVVIIRTVEDDVSKSDGDAEPRRTSGKL